MLQFIKYLLIIMLFTSILGYVLIVLKEKFYLKNNIIIIDNKYVTQEHLNDTDMKEFFLDGTILKAGDEIRVLTRKNEKVIGTLIGAIKKEKSILMITHKNKIVKFDIDNIQQFKILNKYGKFFS
ncbi:hypothetical protein E9840_00215 [Tissierella creatinini]|nr:hypothetical protein E9840_00215 [Tissierella creatinini]TJX69221.1 hypothetical protein E8P77_00905 [Soehngenia saccharolytica]